VQQVAEIVSSDGRISRRVLRTSNKTHQGLV